MSGSERHAVQFSRQHRIEALQRKRDIYLQLISNYRLAEAHVEKQLVFAMYHNLVLIDNTILHCRG
mgnify:CR=1 FL=1